MTVKRAGLGRNLSALLGSASSAHPLPQQVSEFIPIHAIQPGRYQPRRQFDEDTLQTLAQSIQKQGLLQPLVVRAIGEEKYEILAGERRWRASQLAGLTSLPVMIKNVTDEEALAIALIENLQREDLSVLESARAMERLVNEFQLTHQHIADLLSQSRSSISNQLRLLTLEPSVQARLEAGQLEMGHARALLNLASQQQEEAAKLVAEKKLTVRATEALAMRLQAGEAVTQAADLPDFIQHMQQNFMDYLKTKVEVKPGRAGKGKLVIHYESPARLDLLLDRLKPNEDNTAPPS